MNYYLFIFKHCALLLTKQHGSILQRYFCYLFILAIIRAFCYFFVTLLLPVIGGRQKLNIELHSQCDHSIFKSSVACFNDVLISLAPESEFIDLCLCFLTACCRVLSSKVCVCAVNVFHAEHLRYRGFTLDTVS
jgi:hypothetical protein